MAAALEKERCVDGHCKEPRGVGCCFSRMEARRWGVCAPCSGWRSFVLVQVGVRDRFVSLTFTRLALVTVIFEKVRECADDGTTSGDTRCRRESMVVTAFAFA